MIAIDAPRRCELQIGCAREQNEHGEGQKDDRGEHGREEAPSRPNVVGGDAWRPDVEQRGRREHERRDLRGKAQRAAYERDREPGGRDDRQCERDRADVPTDPLDGILEPTLRTVDGEAVALLHQLHDRVSRRVRTVCSSGRTNHRAKPTTNVSPPAAYAARGRNRLTVRNTAGFAGNDRADRDGDAQDLGGRESPRCGR